VYRVRHLALGSLHALKVLSWDRPSIDRRLLLEGRIQAQLRHPNIVAVTDVLRVEGKAALLLDFVDGPTLEDWLTDLDGPLTEAAALDLFAGILAAVVRAHDAGVLHRDLKPQNVLLETVAGRLVAKVADFGLAKVAQDEMAASNTRTNVTMGTPGYMAPEQVRDAASVDARTDVFALGVLLHELLTGDRAFVDDEGHTAVTATLEASAPPLPERVSSHVRAAVDAALARDPDGRPADARALAERLYLEGAPRRRDVLALGGTPLALAPRQGEVAQLAGMSSASVVAGSGGSDPTWGATAVPSEAPPRRGLGAIVVGAGIVVALGLGAAGAAGLWVFLGPDDAPPDPLVDGDPRTQGPRPPSVPEPAPVDVAPIAPAPGGPSADATGSDEPPAPEPVASPPAVPDPAPAPPPGPEPEPEPEPEPVAPEPVAPEPEPVAPEPVQPEPSPQGTADDPPEAGADARVAEMQRLLAGSWAGTADGGRPVVLRIDSVDADGVRGALVFTGPTSRTFDLVGSYDGGALSLSASDGTKVEATVQGGSLTGTYGKGRRTVAFTASR
jgi:serine/threonine-protein kinase